jgi:TonB family protein
MRKALALFIISTPLFADSLSLFAARQAMSQGDLVKAEQLTLDTLDAAQHSKNPSAPDDPLSLLAEIYQREKKFPEAIATQQRRIDLWTGLYGENAVVVGRVLGQLSNIEKQDARFADAEAHARRALAVMTAALPDKPATAQAAVDLADILIRQGREAEALPLLEGAQKIFETSVGPRSALAHSVAARRAKLEHQPAPEGSGVYRVGNGIVAPNILRKGEPVYSEEARKKKLQGTISVSLVVDATGTPTQIAVIRPLGMGLDEKAIEAVSKWKFAPATKDGVPVSVVADVEVSLHLL